MGRTQSGAGEENEDSRKRKTADNTFTSIFGVCYHIVIVSSHPLRAVPFLVKTQPVTVG